MATRKTLLTEISDYYSAKLTEHGETAQGVDWNGAESQELRFRQLCGIIQWSDRAFSINDLGCGYGALYEFLARENDTFTYTGIDVSQRMIQAAKKRCGESGRTRFVLGSEPAQVADYGVASGIFNVRLERSHEEWEKYIQNTLDALDRTSAFGFSFNCLTAYSDEDKMRDYLYYADPCVLFNLCKQRYARNVALLHDYGLYEFTILVRKT